MTPPAAPKFVAYKRVSTREQGRSGLGLEAQQEAITRYVEAHHGRLLTTYTEVESGKVRERPQLEAALLHCRQTRATLLVAKLDRLSRNVGFLMALRESAVKFQALDILEANTLTLTVMAAMAQHEAELISQRTKAALAARRARGHRLGTARDLSTYQTQAAAAGHVTQSGAAQRRAADIRPMIDAARAAGATSLRQIATYLNTAGAPAPRGGAWTAQQVARVTRR